MAIRSISPFSLYNGASIFVIFLLSIGPNFFYVLGDGESMEDGSGAKYPGCSNEFRKVYFHLRELIKPMNSEKIGIQNHGNHG